MDMLTIIWSLCHSTLVQFLAVMGLVVGVRFAWIRWCAR